ncbi:MAG: hypothetical protein EBR71_05770, partial [Planctomycetes bacterium]|nr:hypothetical protein [Planctomycetota bacterium]
MCVALATLSASALAVHNSAADAAEIARTQISDLNHDGVIDGADMGLFLLGEEAPMDELVSELPLPQSQFVAAGARGLFGNGYIVDVSGTKYSVIDVYIKWGSAVGTGTAGERVVAVFGQSTTDTATGGVDKTARYENSASLPFQHLNTSWLPGNANGNSTWDSFLTWRANAGRRQFRQCHGGHLLPECHGSQCRRRRRGDGWIGFADTSTIRWCGRVPGESARRGLGNQRGHVLRFHDPDRPLHAEDERRGRCRRQREDEG